MKDDTFDLIVKVLKRMKCNGGEADRTDLWEGYLEGYPIENDGRVHVILLLRAYV